MRAYNIQINVGDLDHELMGLSDADRAAWLAGFQAGLHGKACPAGHGASQHAGNMFGYACYEKTKRFMDQAAANGAKSAASRRSKNGTAQPPKVVRQISEAPSRVVRENAEVTSNQKPVTINDKPETEPASHCDIFDRSGEPPATASPANMQACDAKFTSGDLLGKLKLIGARMTKANGNLDEWQTLIDKYGWKGVSDAAGQVGPADRWPNRVEQRLWDKENTCPYPPGSYQSMDWYMLKGIMPKC